MNNTLLRHLRPIALGISLGIASGIAAGAANASAGRTGIELPGLQSQVRVLRDVDGMPHIIGVNELDVLRVQGWMHANDRLFQMDQTRRLGAGTLAELLGEGAIASDVELRTIGLGRGAQASLDALSPALRAALDAYAEGVNAWIASNPLPPEYEPLELTSIPPWTPLDSAIVGKAIAFNLSFDLDIDFTEALGTYQQVGAGLGFDGTALFFEDLYRSQPFDPASTVPDASGRAPAEQLAGSKEWRAGARISPSRLALVRQYRDRVERVPFLNGARKPSDRVAGSNEWAVSGQHTTNGRPLLANDPHLSLDTPATFYQNHLRADGLNVIGSSFPGAPAVVLGQTQSVAWGATVHPMDVTDMYFDTIVADPDAPAGFRIVHDDPVDELDQVQAIPVTFRVNVIGDGEPDNLAVVPPVGDIPPLVFIVPRRNNGPIVSLDTITGQAVTIQYTGFSGTRELDTFFAWNHASSLEEFRAGLETFDVGSQNFCFVDIAGNIAYFTSAELPLREDLQAGTVNGLPPYFVREGSGGNEWLPVSNPQPGQAIPYEILPPDEMPQLVNPPAGYFVNANNDPIGNSLDNDPLNELRPGGGIFYLNPGYALGTRAGRITQTLERRLAKGPVTRRDMIQIQADVVLLDAQVLSPYIVQAFANASAGEAPASLAAFAADDRIAEAVERLARWRYNAPTGIPEGYDARDQNGELSDPEDAEIAASVATTIYSMWRGQFIGNTIDATLERVGNIAGVSMPRPGSSETMKAVRHLLDGFDTSQGVGASGLDFFAIEGSDESADVRRDILILQSLADGLDRLASDGFAPAFANSTDQNDYRWGKLHRIVFDHPLGEPFSIPPAGGLFPAPLPGLSGIPVDGGFGVADASSHSARADDLNDFMFGSGPVRRYVGQPGPQGLSIRGQTILPGGASGVLGNEFSVNLLGRWLTNEAYPMRQRLQDILPSVVEATLFTPPGEGD